MIDHYILLKGTRYGDKFEIIIDHAGILQAFGGVAYESYSNRYVSAGELTGIDLDDDAAFLIRVGKWIQEYDAST